MKHLLLLIIIALTNELFDLTPRFGLPGFFNLRSIGLALTVVILFYALIRGHNQIKRLVTPLSWLVLCFLAYEIIQVSIASINYNQSILNGLIGAKQIGFFLVYFIVLLLYDNEEEIESLMKALTILAVCLGLLALINYFGPTILYFKKDRDLMVRSGITRAHVPAVIVIVCAFLWSLSKLTFQPGIKNTWLPTTIFLYGVIIFKQTRMQMVATAMAAFVGLLVFKKYRLLLWLVVVAIVSISVLSVTLKTNPLTSGFVTAVTDVAEGSGTWTGRLEQMKHSWQVFTQNMWTGSGASALRISVVERDSARRHAEHYGADLGYSHLLKFYGLPFVLWFLFFVIILLKAGKRILDRESSSRGVASCRYSILYFGYFFMSMITQNHFSEYPKLVIFALSLAILQICSATDQTSTYPNA